MASKEQENNQVGPEIIVLKFADSKIPLFKEQRNRDYIKYGDDNRYPEYLTYLFNKSAKHNAILTGKAAYVFGKGFENGNEIINRLGESLNDISKKACLDIEIYGGFRFEVIWNLVGKIAEVYHVDYSTIRVGRNGNFYYKESWDKFSELGKEIPAFNPQEPRGSQIFSYTEYRPMTRYYPLPSYIGCNNYVETDIEISKYYLSAIRNGMSPSKMIQFFKGEPTEEKKAEIESRFKKKFAGTENAGQFILVFNDSNATKSVEINDLSGSDLDKQFIELNKTCQQEIFSGHLVTSPMLFGIKTEGQLGGNTELATAYALFQNTYSKPKAQAFSKEIEYLFSFSNMPGNYELLPTDPVGVQFDVKDVINLLPKEFVFTSLGIPKDMWQLENIVSDNAPTKTILVPPATDVAAETSVPVNDNLKNLTTKQLQHINRVVRQHSKGQIETPAAKMLLRNGYGLTDADINDLLGITVPLALSFEDQEDNIIAMFDACGDSREDFEILKSKRVSFSSELECEADEEIFIQEAFKTEKDLTTTEQKILEILKNDPRIPLPDIARVINETLAFVKTKIKNLVIRGIIEEKITTDGVDELIQRAISKDAGKLIPPRKPGNPAPNKISIKYSYEGPEDSKNRPFCAKLMQLRRLYSRAEIETISARLGYSVFDRRGGFWTRKGTNDTTPYCRHNWRSNLIVQK